MCLSGYHDGPVTRVDGLADEAAQGVQEKSIRLIELHEVCSVTHVCPIRARSIAPLSNSRSVDSNYVLSRIDVVMGFNQENFLVRSNFNRPPQVTILAILLI